VDHDQSGRDAVAGADAYHIDFDGFAGCADEDEIL
jgi:hypothetical protein